MLDSASAIVAEHAELERRMTDPEVLADPVMLRKVNKRYAALAPTVAATGDKWTIGPIAYERDNLPSGAGPVTLTAGVNLAGARVITYSTSGATS